MSSAKSSGNVVGSAAATAGSQKLSLSDYNSFTSMTSPSNQEGRMSSKKPKKSTKKDKEKRQGEDLLGIGAQFESH
ncbi:hypothetical protein SAMD00023353_9600270 [Rosellinia necatrix]|uniref:Uncharacterized protein n=1 Tax=Rosellinia necatrix TaxID=77044 RepID=A0A1W2TVM6_ROSNE|nr:hypothetical protein SAMD00023353_9600270 [Rosellinia necatrix]